MNNRRTLSAIAFTVLLTACGSSGPGEQNSSVDPNNPGYEQTDTLPAGTFGSDGEGTFSGDLYVRGYAETQTVDEPFCVEDCQKFEYVMFNVIETGNDHLDDFLGVNVGNAYAGPALIGLGCDEKGIIRYTNHSDQNQMREFTLDAGTSEAILDSTKNNHVTLHLTKLPLSGGTEAPACYSHFSTIELAD